MAVELETEIAMLEQLINITGFSPEPFRNEDIEAALRSPGNPRDLLRLREINVVMRNWVALICFASQLWHGRYAANTFPEAVYGDRLSTDQRGTSSKPYTFDPRVLRHTVKETMICVPNLRS